MTIAVEMLDTETMSEPDRAACASLSELVWPPEVIAVYHGKVSPSAPPPAFEFRHAERPRTFVVRDADRILAKAGVKPRRIAFGEEELTIMALGGVASHPAHRGKHYGKAVVQAAFGLVDSGDFVLSFFQTSHRVYPFYEALGCRSVENRIVNRLALEPERTPFWDEVAVIYPADADWPRTAVDTVGPGW
jgi:GNAT superfamily N-acetyltransferase